MNSGYRSKLDKIQSKLLKTVLGISPYCRSKPLLKALNVHHISDKIDVNCIMLLHRIMQGQSAAKEFNVMLKRNVKCKELLVNRVKHICNSLSVSWFRCIIDSCYLSHVKTKIQKHVVNCEDGLVDSLRYLLKNYNATDKNIMKFITQSILKF